MVKTYKKKPVEIQAIQFTGLNQEECLKFTGGSHAYLVKDGIEIETLEGKMLCSIGDYIIRGVSGEYYPCKPDIFERTYDEVN